MIVVSVLLVLSGIFVLVSSIGFVRLQDFFLRMHPPALAYTFGTWTATLAAVVYFTALESRLLVHPFVLVALLTFTVPVTTVLLARVGLFRRRSAGVAGTPPTLTQPK